MTRTPLARLLSPRSIAVIGGREAAEVVRQCECIGFAGPVWPVNPKRDEVAGRKTFASVADLPEAPDASFIAVPREATIEVVAALAARGAGGAVCYAAGFAEAGPEGAALERALVAAAGGMALTGPNCYGHINYLDGAALWPDQHGGQRVQRGVAIVTQSGNIGQNLTMLRRALPIAMLVTVGNKAKGDMTDYVEAFLDEPRITTIGLHIEGLGDIAGFDRAAARARAKGVPIVVVKSGRSEAGAAIALSHTASLAGPDRLYDALFTRNGVARAPNLSVFVETLKLLHVHGPLAGRRVSSMSCSGGEASLAADLAAAHGLETPPLPDTARVELAAVLGPRVTVANPLDYHTYIWGDRAAQAACFSAMLRAGYGMNLLVLDFPREDRCDGAAWQTTMHAFADAQAATGAPAALVSCLPETLPEANGAWLMERGIAPMQGLGECFAALGLAAEIGEAWRCEKPPPLKAFKPLPPGREMLDDRKARDLLRSLDIRVPYCRAVSPHRAVEAARHIGYPVVMKAVVEGVAHKTEIGGVALDLRTDAQVRDAAQHLGRLSHKVLVESMIEGAVAELIVGISRDAQFGPALTIGAGGTLVELVDDTATLLLPASREEIAGALLSLRVARLLVGFRGRPAGDIAAAIDAIASVAKRASIAASRIAELDINPLLVMPAQRGVFAVDVLVRKFTQPPP